jgi:GTP1/Obg family GTP-binding protein
MYSNRVLVAGKRAWERLSYLLDGELATKFESLDEFDKFYSVLIDKLYDKDNEEA